MQVARLVSGFLMLNSIFNVSRIGFDYKSVDHFSPNLYEALLVCNVLGCGRKKSYHGMYDTGFRTFRVIRDSELWLYFSLWLLPLTALMCFIYLVTRVPLMNSKTNSKSVKIARQGDIDRWITVCSMI